MAVRPHRPNGHSSRGLTFVEVLAALLFMSVLIPVAVQGVMVANRAGVMAERKRQAAELANNCLTERIVTDDWRQAPQQDGDFGEGWPGFHWKLTTEAWQDATMQVVKIEVTFRVQEKEQRIWLSTLAPTAPPTGTATQTLGTMTKLGVQTQ